MTDPHSPERNNADPVAADQYRVLARKYRPSTFAGLIGQEALVRTLTNAIASGRLAHAFILTGVRGVGKTTTARIIARALNCIGADGAGGPTAEPCGACEHCRSIAEDRHVDVLEMDAASRSKVEEMRELLDGVRYRPTSARYKVYIIDEVHMLSKHAFNALLKTLEEPPEHVKFIFATTETRKIPVTVLSRCQRFDLRRIDLDTLIAHFKEICEKEGAAITAGALTLIARAADGSVRDGLSLLDQAIAQSGYSSEQGGDVKGEIDDAMVRDMLGLADRTMTFDLFESVMKGDIRDALGQMDGQYKSGADPVQVIEDMLDLTHWLTRIKVVPDAAEVSGAPEAERVRGREMAEGLSMAAVSRAWQMLLKGLEEVRLAPHPVQAVDMILVRLAHASALPTPAEAIKALKQEQAQSSSSSSSAQSTPAGAPSSPPASPPGSAGTGTAPSAPESMPSSPVSPDQPRALASGGAVSALTSAQPSGRPEPEMAVETGVLELPVPDTFAAVVELTSERREALLHANLINNVHLVNFEKGRIEFRPGDRAPSELAHDLSRFLNDHTALRWLVMVSGEPGDATLRQQLDASDAAEKNQAADHPLVRAVMETFPGAAIEKVTKILPPETAVPSEQEIPVPGDET